MRKKHLRVRNDQLRLELSGAQQLTADQMRQINEHRMQIAILKAELDLQSVGATERPEPAPVIVVDLGMKTCPECAEEVRVAARRCRYCNHRFETADSPRVENGSKDSATNGSTRMAELG